MVQRMVNMDWQMVVLNYASVGSLITATVNENSTGWSIGFLIITVGVLNLAKAYSTIRESRKKNKEDEE